METKYKRNYLEFEYFIAQTKAFRALTKKTQVFIYKFHDQIENRAIHTQRVEKGSKLVAKKLGLNISLASAIATGHDVGHVPYGHVGERILNELTKEVGGFWHNEQSVRVLTIIEPIPDIPYEVLEGILKHGKVKHPKRFKEFRPNQSCISYEGQIVSYVDEIVTLESDLYDGSLANLIDSKDVMEIFKKAKGIHENLRFIEENGFTSLEELFIDDLIAYSLSVDYISFSQKMNKLQQEIRDFIVENCIKNPRVARSDARGEYIIKKLFKSIENNQLLVETKWKKRFEQKKDPLKRTVADYISGLSDEGAERLFRDLFETCHY